MDQKTIAKIIEECLKKVEAGSKNSKLADELRTTLSSALSRLDLVSREDFEAQKRLLDRTVQMAEQLETRIAELEQKQS